MMNGMNSRNPLLLPEILSKVLQYVDLNTLKTSRLVSSFWNVEAGRILSSSYWVDINTDDEEENSDALKLLKLASFLQTLATSQDPGKFFGKLKLSDNWFHGNKLHKLLQNYGKYLNALDYIYYRSKSTEDGSSYCQLFIYRVLTKWCPHLVELSLSFYSEEVRMNLAYPIPSLNFNDPINLRRINIFIAFEVKKKFQDFLVRIIEGCTNLKELIISRRDVNHQMYDKLAGLHHISKNLNEFVWHGKMDHNLGWTKLMSAFQFSSKLKKLSMLNVCLNLKSFPVMAVMLNSIAPSLKKLELLDCVFNVDTFKEFQSDLFNIVIKSLVNLEILRIEYLENGDDNFFSNADSLDALPHQNLRHLFLPLCSKLKLQISSVSSVVKWFPNLTRLTLWFGNGKDFYTTGVGIQFAEVIGILAGLKRLEDLLLEISSISAPGDLQNTLRTLKQIPKLVCCTLAELGKGTYIRHGVSVKTTHTLKSLRYGLKQVEFLNLIRLVGFKFTREKSILDFARKNGIRLELHDEHFEYDSINY